CCLGAGVLGGDLYCCFDHPLAFGDYGHVEESDQRLRPVASIRYDPLLSAVCSEESRNETFSGNSPGLIVDGEYDFVQSNLTPATWRPLLTPIRKGVMFPGVWGCLGMSGVGASVPFTAWYPTLNPALKLSCGPPLGIAQSGMTNPPPATCSST